MLDCGLFDGIPEEEYDDALRYLRASRRSFMRGEIIQHIGSEFRCSGLVLEGVIECSYQDPDFNKYNMNHFSAGELFGESMCCAGVDESPMEISALTDCVIMFLDFGELFTRTSYEHHAVLAGNLMRMLAAKNIFLNRKVRILSTKSLRDNWPSPHHSEILINYSKACIFQLFLQDFHRLSAPALAHERRRFLVLELQLLCELKPSRHAG